jgi:L-asparaginase/Glu-tRNA(Gln) amidotransferase subunit D
VVENEQLMDSSDMGPDDWKRIAERIEGSYFDYDGFVVIMGTDTMAYCASAVSFMLENLGKPVIFTGAQIPLAEVINDARRNLSASMLLAANLDIPEVVPFSLARSLTHSLTRPGRPGRRMPAC